MTAVAELLLLQDTDLALDKALARLSEIEIALGESDELISAREAAAERAAAVAALRAQQKDLELAADEVRNKGAVIEKKLYGGTVKNPKECKTTTPSSAPQGPKTASATTTSLLFLCRSKRLTPSARLPKLPPPRSRRSGAPVRTSSSPKKHPSNLKPRASKPSVRQKRLTLIAASSACTIFSANAAAAPPSPASSGNVSAAAYPPMSVLQRARVSLALSSVRQCERILL